MPSWASLASGVGTSDERRAAARIGKAVRSFIDNVDDAYSAGKGLLLVGPPGRGKSYVGCAVLRSLPSKYRYRFATLKGFIRLNQRSFSEQSAWEKGYDAEAYERWRKIQKLLNRLRNEYDFLLIDDVGKEYRTSSNFAENEFDYLLRHRYDRGLPTLMTSNVPLDQWVETYGEAMHSFVHECVYLIDMNGLPDLRRSARA